MMRLHRLLSIVCLAILMCAGGCTVAPRMPSLPFTAARPSDDVLAGGKLYAQHCAACHGVDAEGRGRAPSLHSPSVQVMTDDGLVQFLTDGDLRKGMPSWSGLSSARRWQLVRFVRRQQPPVGEARRLVGIPTSASVR